ncbi:hypothetical protein G6F68_014476 [Rhizopus microsporus]|nr:hypothetical protein G6F68_014476 [Rhizopus microsporus]
MMSGTVCISVVFLYRRRYLYTQGMTTDLHDLKPGYYWYTMANDPLAVIHIHEDGGASLMGTDYRSGAEGVADMVRQGERFFWIEPPQG